MCCHSERRNTRACFLGPDEPPKIAVILSGAPRGRRRGGAESKDPVELTRDVHREVHGILRLRSGRKAPFSPLRMTAIWKVHWQRSSERAKADRNAVEESGGMPI